MRTLAPIRVRHCECGDDGTGFCRVYRATCRLCGRYDHAYRLGPAVEMGLRHLSIHHPWPWADVDNGDGSH